MIILNRHQKERKAREGMTRRRGRRKAAQNQARKREQGRNGARQRNADRTLNLRGIFKSSILKFAVWALVAALAVLIPSYTLYRMDQPAGTKATFDQQASHLASSNFSFGFDREDISSVVTLWNEEAMSVRWQRTPADGALLTTFSFGPYAVGDKTTQAELVLMVPVSAHLLSCSYVDMNPAQLTGEIQRLGDRDAQCATSRSSTAQFFSTRLMPNSNEPGSGLYQISVSVGWRDPTLVGLGVGRDLLSLQYRGGVVLESTRAFHPADSVKISYGKAESGERPEGPMVFLKFMVHPSDTLTEVAPEPGFARNRTQIWISTRDRPTYNLSLLIEDRGARRLFELAGQGIFLVVGAVIGAFVPRMRLRRSKRD